MIKWIGEHIWDFVSRFRNDVIIESDTGAKPEVFIKNQANTSGAGQLIFERDYTTSSGKICGEISFRGRNDAGEEGYGYAFIQGKQKSVAQGSETGEMSLGVRSTGATRIGLKLEAGDDSQDVDVTLGHATTSTTTVVGGLTFDSVALTAVQTASESFADNDTSLMTSAAIDDRINAAGGSVSVSDSTANTAFPIVFHDESNNLHDDTGTFTYNPSTGDLAVPGDLTSAAGFLFGRTVLLDTAPPPLNPGRVR